MIEDIYAQRKRIEEALRLVWNIDLVNHVRPDEYRCLMRAERDVMNVVGGCEGNAQVVLVRIKELYDGNLSIVENSAVAAIAKMAFCQVITRVDSLALFIGDRISKASALGMMMTARELALEWNDKDGVSMADRGIQELASLPGAAMLMAFGMGHPYAEEAMVHEGMHGLQFRAGCVSDADTPDMRKRACLLMDLQATQLIVKNWRAWGFNGEARYEYADMCRAVANTALYFFKKFMDLTDLKR